VTKFFDALAAVCFHYADDDVFAAAVAANGFAEHGEGFADARRVAQKKLEVRRALFPAARRPPAILQDFWSLMLP
jgi:hypothetical protein